MSTETLNSPFKFLHPYAREDRSIFFGREDEVEKLYQYTHINRIVLVYGTSGTGKTSLVQCGLANPLEVTDWMPFFIRRAENINGSLQETIFKSKALETPPEPGLEAGEQLLYALEQISAHYLRPIYLIFDQFEELLILGEEDEIKKFIETICRIIQCRETQSCKMIFILREEYFAWLGSFEESIPGFADRRLRVEPMRLKQVSDVIIKSCRKFNIALENPPENAKQIYSILDTPSGFSLPYLQVYLDQLWRQQYLHTYKDHDPLSVNPSHINVTTAEIRECGQIKDVLDRFLNERRNAVQKELKGDFSQIGGDTVKRILDAFVSDRGTKLPLRYTRTDDGIVFTDAFTPPYLKSLNPVVLTRCIASLEINRILANNGVSIELAHDILARVINQERTHEQRRLNDMRRQIYSSFEEYSLTREYLSEKQLAIYNDADGDLELEPRVALFYAASDRYRRRIRRVKRLTAGLVLTVLVAAAGFLIKKKVTNDIELLEFLGNNVNAIRSKEDALRIVEQIHHEVGEKNSLTVQNKFLELFQTQEIQSKYSLFTLALADPNLKWYEMDMSASGAFTVVKTSNRNGPDNQGSNTGTYQVVSIQGDTIRRFDGVYYTYFTNKPDVALLAMSVIDSVLKINNYSPFRDYPNTLLLFNCRTGRIVDSFSLPQRAFLYPGSQVGLTENNDYDSYRVRYTASDKLLVPFQAFENDGRGRRWLGIRDRNEFGKKIVCEASVSISKDGKRFMTGTSQKNGNFHVAIADDAGSPITGFDNVSFGDFTEKGSEIFGADNQLTLRSTGARPLKFTTAFPIEYAFADGDENVILVQGEGKLQVINKNNKLSKVVTGKLVGVNFDRNLFVTLNPFYSGQGAACDTVWKRSFLRPEASCFLCSEGISQVVYNRRTDNTLVFTKNYRLYLLDDSLHKKAAFRLTANDLYGFSPDGSALFYVRDNSLSVFRNDKHLLNVFSFDSCHNALNNMAALNQPLTREELKKYHVPESFTPFGR